MDPNDINTSFATGYRLSNPTPGDEVVITGIAGRYPESDNVYELQDNLFNKIDLVNDDSKRWLTNDLETPSRLGKIKQLNKYDAEFFGITDEVADFMDPMARILMEAAYEAIVDAGINPNKLRGTRTGVFIGTSFVESEGRCIYENNSNGFGIKGCSRAMLANRISSWLEITGPSFAVDTACSSASYALDHAFKCIRDGHCESALVAGSNLCLNPNVCLQFSRLGVLSADGRCKSFDANADGYARADSISIILLQKMTHAKRVYAKVIYTKTNCDGFKKEGVTFPSEKLQIELLTEFYKDCGIPPHSVGYVEAHGTGTRVGDKVESKALDIFFSPGRAEPLKVGTIKSNIGHSEPAAGITAIAKACIIFETGIIPPNLNYATPLPGPIEEGRLKLITKRTYIDSDLIGINSFGFGGANCHILLERNKVQKSQRSKCVQQSCCLVVVSGRTEMSINCVVNDVLKRKFDPEFYRLINDVHQDTIAGHMYRGFVVVAKTQLEASSCISHKVNCLPETKRPICFVFTGLWSVQIVALKQLLTIPAFSATIRRCNQILSPMELDVLLVYKRPSVNLMKSLLGSVCMQVGLVATLKSVGITPDCIIGDSIGELICAFADNCLTMEQTILAAYYVGKSLMNAGYKNIAKLEMSLCTIINRHLRAVIPEPVERSDKWISLTASTETKLNSKSFFSADHFTDNLSTEVCLDKVYKCIAPNAITLQFGLAENTRNESAKNKTHIALLGNKHMDSNESVAIALGQLYLAGCDVNIAELYPAVKFPVSRGTPMISPLVKWNHCKDRVVSDSFEEIKSGNRTVTISLTDDDLKYLSDHVIDGRNLFPGTGYLQLVWETVGMMRGQSFKDVSIVFEDIQFLRATNIPKEGSIELAISVQKATGNFEITESGVTVISGRVFVPDDITQEQSNLDLETSLSGISELSLDSDDIYKEFRLRGYNFSGSFRGLLSCDGKAIAGEVLWEDNWVCFLDSMMQMFPLAKDTRQLCVPTAIQKLSINCKAHAQNILENMDKKFVKVYQFASLDIIKSAGVEVRGIRTKVITRRRQNQPLLEVHKFIPYFSDSERTLSEILYINISLALENLPALEIKIVEVLTNSSTKSIAKEMVLCLKNIALNKTEVVIVKNSDVILSDPGEGVVVTDGHLENQSNCFMVIGREYLQNDKLLQKAVKALSSKGYLLLREKLSPVLEIPSNLQLLTSYVTTNECLLLLKRKSTPRDITAIRIDDCDLTFRWLDTVKKAITADKRVVLYAESQATNGILGLVNCVRKEPGGEQVQCVFILDKNAPPFSIEDDFYGKQLDLNLAVNVFKDGQWGSYRFLLIDQGKLVLAEHAFIDIPIRGDLSSLQWTQGSLTKSGATPVNTTLVKPYFCSINFRDVMEATNKLADNGFEQSRNKPSGGIGFEYSGITRSARRVMGFALPPLLSTLIQADDLLMWDVPDGWTLQEAATVPVVYGTVLHALITVGGIREGMDVLIHAGSGAVGQAAITVALHYKCTVYTTVGTKEKRDFIIKQFPQIKNRHIGNSRDTSFEQLVLTETKGRGVHLVLNSLAEDKLFASVRCLAQNGRFLEIGKFDLMNNNKLSIANFTKGISFHGVMLNSICSANNENKKKLRELLAAGIKSGIVRPLPFTTFKSNQVEDAFRFMAAGKHIGKVLIQLRIEEHEVDQVVDSPIYSTPRFYCHPSMTYVLCGGLGGFGLELADWLVLRGAKKLVLTSRHGVTTGYQDLRIQTWKGYGCIIKISTVDCSTLKSSEDLLQDAESIGPVAAIFNLAVVLKDAILENQNGKTFRQSFSPKVDVTRNFDVASRKFCPQLQYFVVFSSISCGRGNAGQTNYGMANSVMERICEARVQEGLPGLAIQWGAIGDVGLLAYIQGVDGDIQLGGTLAQSISSCLEVMDNLLRSSEPVVASMLVAQGTSKTKLELTAIEYVAALIGVRDVRLVSAQTTLPELGMDSMMVIEMKQGLERDYGIFLTANQIRQLTFTSLKQLTEAKSCKSQKFNAYLKNDERHATDYDSLSPYLLVNRFCSEAEASQTILQLPSLETSDSMPTVFLIPGMEGVSISVKPLALKLKCKVLCLQLPYQSSYKSVVEISKELLPHVKSNIKDVTSVNFVGYSFGCLIAFELMRILESEGYRGKLCFIDGAPELIKHIADTETKDQKLQINILTHLTVDSSDMSSELLELLRNEPSWDKKMQLFLEISTTDFQFSKDLMKLIYNSMYFRTRAHINYEPVVTTPLNSITLIRPTRPVVANAEEDYSLSKWTRAPVPVHFIEANHATVVDADQCADFINKLFRNDST